MRFAGFKHVMIGLAGALLLAAGAHADSIRLKASVRLPANADAVRLAHIATLEGDEAQELADLVIAELTADGGRLTLTVGDVREKLDEAGVHWGRVNLSGRKVLIRPRHRAAAPPSAMHGVTLPGTSENKTHDLDGTDDLLAASIIDESSLRGAIARSIAASVKFDPADLRLLFDQNDREFLLQSDATRRFELDLDSSLTSDRVSCTVRTWAEGRIERSDRLTLRLLVHAATAVLRRDVQRGEALGEQDYDIRRSWLPPRQAALACEPARIAGRLATSRLQAGDVVRDKHLKRQMLIQRRDRVMVRCLVGGVVISLQAQACEDGAEGDRIELKKNGERETFVAVVTGPGEAIVDLSDPATGQSPPTAD